MDSWQRCPFPKYESCSLCYLQLTTAGISFCNAGLPKPLLIKNQQYHDATLPEENLGPIGRWSSHPVTRCSQIELAAGEILVVYTDGLFEKGKDDKEFGQTALKQLFLDHHHQELSTLIDTVFKTVNDFYQPEGIEDDGTVLIIRRKITNGT